ncbi:GNAT family N-acetyltransferase [Thalassolituus maritimus]|uniref:L-ornithine N(alpha)-acyltransferase n=1 Tax=Thalassolituus maritimus TaxID=484498 RepID=A0ABP9ZV89_9GAMM|nr:GNAT family N-acyltransferase [Pseudomonadota bacterium]|tara:strand:+ start:151 stop:906 length:756 start_codon:yes stop_codon:yes gene_type:complete
MAQSNAQLSISPLESGLVARITDDPREIRQALELRYRVFAEDMGAEVEGADLGIDKDRFDDICLHLIVKDNDTDAVVAYSRILTNDLATRAGGFYSSTEFDLSNVLQPGKTYMEIGRTCVDPDFRSGAAIGYLWGFLAEYLEAHRIDYLMGCCSIPVQGGYEEANAIMNHLREKHMTDATMRAEPMIPVPFVATSLDGKTLIPSLLKAYLRIGVKVCGEPFLDKDFGVADAMILLRREDMNYRFLSRILRG